MATETVEPKKRLIATFMHFLTEELADESLSADSKDSIEGMFTFSFFLDNVCTQ